MSFEKALRGRIKADAGVTGDATFVEWDKRPQGRDTGVVLTIIDALLAQHMGGFQAKRSARVQMAISALDAPTKVRLRDAVIAAITPRGVVGGVAFERTRSITVVGASQQTDTQFIHRDVIDAIFWFREVEN
ncbi:MAG: hypothetical protein OSB00_09745 [Sphingomonas bacterium]|nr:hypothetical protein [Sphingomonas bacterium]